MSTNPTGDISHERYTFWMDDITVLFRNNQYIQFVPMPEMTRVEQLNALTRFCFYLIILLFLLDKTDELMYLPICGIILFIVLYNVFEIDEKGKRQELLRMKRRIYKDHYEEPEINYRTYQVNDNGDVITVDIDQEEAEKYKQDQEAEFTAPTDYGLEAGFYGSDGKLYHGEYDGPIKPIEKDKISYSLDEIRTYESSKCRKPTEENPFMNPSVDDFNKENVPVACNADDEDIGKEIRSSFNADLYRDIEDVFDKKNSQRQFFTIAHNIPNDQEAFARWCYKFPATCKTDQERCLNYEDLRTKY